MFLLGAGLPARAEFVTTNADPYLTAGVGNVQSGPPLLDIIRLSVDGGRIFTNQVTGATPFGVGSTIRTVGAFTVGTAQDGTLSPVSLPDGSVLTAEFGIQGTVTSNSGGIIKATFTIGELFLVSKSTGNGFIFDIKHPGTWNFANTFAQFKLQPQQNVIDGNTVGIVPEDIFSSAGAGSVSFAANTTNVSGANTNAAQQAQGVFLVAKDGGGTPLVNPGLGTHTGDNFLVNFDTIGGPPNPETNNGGLVIVTNQTALSSIPSTIGNHATGLTLADQVALNNIGIASGFTGAFALGTGPVGSPGSFDPLGITDPNNNGDFVADLTGDQYPAFFLAVASVPEPSSLVLLGIATGMLGLHAHLRRRVAKLQTAG